MILRKVKNDDFTNIVEIVNKNYDQEVINHHSKEIIEKFRKENTVVSLERQATWKEIFVVEEDGEIIGTGALANFSYTDVPKYCVPNLFVVPEFHRKGIGRLLVYRIIEEAKLKSCKSLHVPSSRSGFEFYKKIGFTEDDVEFQSDKADELTWMTLNLQI